jgi:16S rRNA (adenine1518-N6/adenine1519-N6)-dimethyltransferase
MDRTTRRHEVRQRLSTLGIRPSRRLGQSFLLCEDVAAAAATEVEKANPRAILEIGPGLGALTAALAPAGIPLIAVEVDRRLATWLAETFASRDHVRIEHGDIRAFDPAAIDAGGPPLVVGSIPYRLSSEILCWLVEHRDATAGALLLTQREVAEKIHRSPGKDGSALGVLVQAYAQTSLSNKVPRACFEPVPDVESRLWTLCWREEPAFTAPEERFFAIARALYGARRKMVRTALRSTLDRERIEPLLRAAGIDPTVRGETLSLGAIDALAIAWCAEDGKQP